MCVLCMFWADWELLGGRKKPYGGDSFEYKLVRGVGLQETNNFFLRPYVHSQ